MDNWDRERRALLYQLREERYHLQMADCSNPGDMARVDELGEQIQILVEAPLYEQSV